MGKSQTKKEYDVIMKNKAYTGLALRVIVACYFVYLAWKIFSGMMEGSGVIPVPAVWAICLGFTVAALLFCLYAWRLFGKALKAAEITQASPSDIPGSGEQTISTGQINGKEQE